jgi:hypothetical protein
MEKRDNAMGLHMHSIEAMMPSVVVGHVLTPSDATKQPAHAATLLGCLNLNESAALIEPMYSRPEQAQANFSSSSWADGKFLWPAGAKETHSYDETIKYLEFLSLNRSVYLVAHGNNLISGNLFDVDIYSLRRRRDQHRGVVHHHRLRGRTDLVLFHENTQPLPEPEEGRIHHILRHQVDVCIEVKRPQDIKKSSTGCEMEAILQLVGMNVNNQYSSPVVVLTDLVEKHLVFRLGLHHNCDTGCDTYQVTKQKCVDFASAMHLATRPRDAISNNFSRPPTPEQDEIPVTHSMEAVPLEDIENDSD